MNDSDLTVWIAECPCGWSRLCDSERQRAEVLRYHRIQVHNDLAATQGPAY